MLYVNVICKSKKPLAPYRTKGSYYNKLLIAPTALTAVARLSFLVRLTEMRNGNASIPCLFIADLNSFKIAFT